MSTVQDLKSFVISKAVTNVQRGYMQEADSNMFRPEVRLDLQRSLLMTESFKSTDGQAMVTRRAKALRHVLENMNVFIRRHEKIVGYQVAHPNNLYHPIDLNWKSVNRLVNSAQGASLLSTDEKKQFQEACDYWTGKSMSDRHQEIFGGDLKKYWKYEGTFLWSQWSELGMPDYEKLFETGLSGRIQQAKDRIESLEAEIPNDYIEKKEFLQSVIIILEAVVTFANRYADCAEEMASKEKNGKRKSELESIVKTCRRVPEHPPQTFVEAVQFFFFIHLVRYLEYSTLGIGLHIDYLLGPFYERDLSNGRITEGEASEILQLLWLKLVELGIVWSPMLTSVYGGVASLQAVTIGGVDRNGKDVTNKLTYLVLDTAEKMRMIEPSIALRVHRNTPEKLLSKTVDVLRTGIGYPSLFNDDALIPMLESWGVPREDALRYAVSGCVYMDIPGKNITRRVVGYFSLPKCLYWALRQGVDPETNTQWGAKTKNPRMFASWLDVLDAYLEQVKFFSNKLAKLENTCRELYAAYCPRPFYSGILDGCIERAEERTRWIYPSKVHDFIVLLGSNNVADALVAIKKVVFEDKTVSLETLIAAMESNWKDQESLQHACLNAPKYGNDDDDADAIAAIVHERTEEAIATAKDRFGYPMRGDGSAVSATYGLAAATPATADGRRDGEPFADSTLAPQVGVDKKGPTAVLNSCSKIDTMKTYNHLLNQKFLPEFLKEDMKPIFLNYLKTWREKGIPHIQFNVIDRETLIAAKENPLEHQDLIVRVAGYSAHFVELSDGLQDQIIARTEQRLG